MEKKRSWNHRRLRRGRVQDRRAACLGGQQESETTGERRSRGQKWLILGNSSLVQRVGV